MFFFQLTKSNRVGSVSDSVRFGSISSNWQKSNRTDWCSSLLVRQCCSLWDLNRHTLENKPYGLPMGHMWIDENTLLYCLRSSKGLFVYLKSYEEREEESLFLQLCCLILEDDSLPSGWRWAGAELTEEGGFFSPKSGLKRDGSQGSRQKIIF